MITEDYVSLETAKHEEFHHPYTFLTYEEACESAIKYCLEKLI